MNERAFVSFFPFDRNERSYKTLCNPELSILADRLFNRRPVYGENDKVLQI